MRAIFVGFLFIFFNLNINAGDSVIGLIPNFVGYILLVRGIKELENENERFIKLNVPVKCMLVYTILTYIFDLFALDIGVLAFILGIISVAVSLYITWNIVVAIEEMEVSQHRNLNGEKLYYYWKISAITSIVAYVLAAILPTFGIAILLASFVLYVIFLVQFNKTKKLYYGEVL